MDEDNILDTESITRRVFNSRAEHWLQEIRSELLRRSVSEHVIDEPVDNIKYLLHVRKG